MSSDTFALPDSYSDAAAHYIIDEFVQLRELGIYEDRIMRKLDAFSKAKNPVKVMYEKIQCHFCVRAKSCVN